MTNDAGLDDSSRIMVPFLGQSIWKIENSLTSIVPLCMHLGMYVPSLGPLGGDGRYHDVEGQIALSFKLFAVLVNARHP